MEIKSVISTKNGKSYPKAIDNSQLIGKKIKKVPRGIQNIFEFLLESALNLADSVTGERKKTEKFLPIALALFLFVLILPLFVI